MNKKVFIINGSGSKGKDTFVEFCSKCTNVKNISTVDKVKLAGELLGCDGKKTEKNRKFWSDLKLLADEYFGHSIDYVKQEYKSFINNEAENVMFIHCREPENIETLVGTFECKTLLILNTNVEDITTNMADANVNNHEYDYYINNSGTLEDLELLAKKFIENIN